MGACRARAGKSPLPSICRQRRGRGPLALVEAGDLITLNATTGEISVAADLSARQAAIKTDTSDEFLMGRELFTTIRANMSAGAKGGSFIL